MADPTVLLHHCSPSSFHKIRDGQLEFFPLLASLALEKEEDTTAMQLAELKCMVQHVLARFKEEVSSN